MSILWMCIFAAVPWKLLPPPSRLLLRWWSGFIWRRPQHASRKLFSATQDFQKNKFSGQCHQLRWSLAISLLPLVCDKQITRSSPIRGAYIFWTYLFTELGCLFSMHLDRCLVGLTQSRVCCVLTRHKSSEECPEIGHIDIHICVCHPSSVQDVQSFWRNNRQG